MSAEEEEIPVELSIEDQLTSENTKPTKLNKNGKPRKILSPEALEKLKLAREKANAIRKESYTKKLEDKVQKLKSVKKEETFEENEKEVVEEKVSKPKGKKKTKIIVEQSSDDSDQFEPNDNVVFVKRVSRKKKDIPAPEPVKEPELEQELPPPEEPQQRPPTRQLTPQELALKNQYSAMFSGGFMNKRNYY
jgi:hypothetical protein